MTGPVYWQTPTIAWTFEPMAVDDIMRQPQTVWQCVEQGLRDSEGYRDPAHDVEQPGWLTGSVLEELRKTRFPVDRWFTACALRDRSVRERRP